MLNLPEFEVLLKEQNEHFYRFTVERIEPPFIRTNCGEIKSEYTNPDAEFKRHQVKEPTVLNCGVDLATLSKILEEGRF